MMAERLTVVGTIDLRLLNKLLLDLAHRHNLPEEAILPIIREYLVVERLRPEEVAVAGASSDRGDFPLDAVLFEDDETWWMSQAGSMPNGIGKEYLEFSLSPQDKRARRITGVSVQIPPLPLGPLAVRRFRIDHTTHGMAWIEGNQILSTSNTHGLQRFDLPHMDALRVRFVCLSNYASILIDDESFFDSVGLFTVLWR